MDGKTSGTTLPGLGISNKGRAFKKNRTIRIVNMDLIWVESAEHLSDFKIRIVFNNGTVKTVNLENHLDKPVFLPLKDVAFFRNFKINPFTIEWENGADFAPEFLYSIGQ